MFESRIWRGKMKWKSWTIQLFGTVGSLTFSFFTSLTKSLIQTQLRLANSSSCSTILHALLFALFLYPPHIIMWHETITTCSGIILPNVSSNIYLFLRAVLRPLPWQKGACIVIEIISVQEKLRLLTRLYVL